MISLTDKVALVTGGGMGIGRAICQAYAEAGARVAVADFNAQSGQQTVQLIKDAGGDAIFIEADVSDESAVQTMVQSTVEQLGGLHAACNSAAVSRGSGPIHEYTREVFDSTLEMCLTNTWLCMKYEIAAMLEHNQGAETLGSIVNISSNASLKGQAYNTAYASAKAGVNVLTQSSASEYGGKGIRINAVSPGVIRTPGIENYLKEQPHQAEIFDRASVMKRMGKPEEIANAVVFLSSDRASFITGQILSVDGGMSVK
ncbi:MAG: SDR family oxidoreductase [Gammaproteobacteria bacterium]|nr:SDR family oxidoreductase [Gammaproteobacteria bacterium]